MPEDKESFAKVENDKALWNFDTLLILRDRDSVSFCANLIIMNLITSSGIPSEGSAIIIESTALFSTFLMETIVNQVDLEHLEYYGF